jgi:hypothetical protein
MCWGAFVRRGIYVWFALVHCGLHYVPCCQRRRRIDPDVVDAIGVPATAIREIENGRGSDQRQNQYAAWLTRIEAWPAGKREREVNAAREGQRFLAEVPIRRGG